MRLAWGFQIPLIRNAPLIGEQRHAGRSKQSANLLTMVVGPVIWSLIGSLVVISGRLAFDAPWHKIRCLVDLRRPFPQQPFAEGLGGPKNIISKEKAVRATCINELNILVAQA
jgi:hypothetical protein